MMPWRERVLCAMQDEEVSSAADCAPQQTAQQDDFRLHGGAFWAC